MHWLLIVVACLASLALTAGAAYLKFRQRRTFDPNKFEICRQCDGEGSKTSPLNMPQLGLHAMSRTCMLCYGNGYVPIGTQRPGGSNAGI